MGALLPAQQVYAHRNREQRPVWRHGAHETFFRRFPLSGRQSMLGVRFLTHFLLKLCPIAKAFVREKKLFGHELHQPR